MSPEADSYSPLPFQLGPSGELLGTRIVSVNSGGLYGLLPGTLAGQDLTWRDLPQAGTFEVTKGAQILIIGGNSQYADAVGGVESVEFRILDPNGTEVARMGLAMPWDTTDRRYMGPWFDEFIAEVGGEYKVQFRLPTNNVVVQTGVNGDVVNFMVIEFPPQIP